MKSDSGFGGIDLIRSAASKVSFKVNSVWVSGCKSSLMYLPTE